MFGYALKHPTKSANQVTVIILFDLRIETVFRMNYANS